MKEPGKKLVIELNEIIKALKLASVKQAGIAMKLNESKAMDSRVVHGHSACNYARSEIASGIGKRPAGIWSESYITGKPREPGNQSLTIPSICRLLEKTWPKVNKIKEMKFKRKPIWPL